MFLRRSVCVRFRLSVAVLALCGFSLMPKRATAATRYTARDGADAPLSIRTAGNVDEELFLLNMLEENYLTWPSADSPKAFVAELEHRRQILLTVRHTILANRLDPGLLSAYDDSLSLIDANEAYLAELGVIEQRAIEQTKKGAVQAAIDGLKSGFNDDNEERTGSDILEDIVVGAVWSALKQGWTISRERQAAAQTAKQRLTDKTNAVLGSAALQSRKLMDRKHWQTGEVDFDLDRAESPSQWASRQPRNPFAIYFSAIQGSEKDTSAATSVQRAKLCVHAAELVPARRLYDPYRQFLISKATDLALQAANLESSGMYSNGPTASAPCALVLSRTYLALNPQDATGYGHVEISRALAFSGRYGEAVRAATVALPRWRDDALFSYRYAKLMSPVDSPDDSAKWLRRAYQHGFNNLPDVRKTSDFANLRRERPRLFAELTTVRLRTHIGPGFIWHDAVFYNDSSFDITHLKTHLKFLDQGNSQFFTDVTCEGIAAGQSCIVKNAVRFSGNFPVNFQYECDQMH
jgi:hypothetical protein